MYIKSIQFKNHSVFRDLFLDFCDEEGTPLSTIFIVGENGLGKTKLLSEIFWIAHGELFRIMDDPDRSKKIVITIVFSKKEQKEIVNFLPKPFRTDGVKEMIIDRLHTSKIQVKSNTNTIYDVQPNEELAKSLRISLIDADEFNAPPSITIDMGRRYRNLSSENIKKLISKKITDLQISDDVHVANIVKSNPEKNVPSSEIDKSIKQFKSIINSLFLDKDYIGFPPPTQASSNISFRTGDTNVDLEGLSSGEKDLLFKIIFLLEDFSSILLIDEPEQGLHPSWQLKVIENYKKISESKSQFIIVTHSPYIFKEQLKNPRTGLLILSKVNQSKLTAKKTACSSWGTFPWSPSWNEINFYAYNIPSTDFHDELYGYIQQENKLDNITETELYFNNNHISKSKTWIREDIKKPPKPEDVTLQTFIRNKTHHPENKSMRDITFDDDELKTSITQMIELLKK